MHLDTTYFVKNKKLITKNIVAKYFLLLQITIHPFLLLGWSMNSAWTSKKKKQLKGNQCKRSCSTQTWMFYFVLHEPREKHVIKW